MIIWNPRSGYCLGCIQNRSGRKSVPITLDYDYIGTAEIFGWSLTEVQNDGEYCEHTCTDGTIDCEECGITVDDFIQSAVRFLQVGHITEDYEFEELFPEV